MTQQPEHQPLAIPPPVPDARIQAMIAILLANQQVICHYPSGTLVFQFAKNEVQAKVTYTLPS